MKKIKNEKDIKRFDNLDLMKCIALLMIILIHNFYCSVDFINNSSPIIYCDFVVRLFIEGVPIFIFVNGFLIMHKKLELKKHIKKTLKIFSIILLWSLIYTLLFSKNLNIKFILKNILNTNISNSFSGILWFFQNLIQLYLFFPLLKVVHEKDKKIYNYFFILILFFTFGSNLIDLVVNLGSSLLSLNNLPTLVRQFIDSYNPISNGIFICYFMLGNWAYENTKALKKHKKSLYISTIIFWISIVIYGIGYSNVLGHLYSNNYNYNTFVLGLIVLSLYTCTINYHNNCSIINKIIKFIGANSMGIYLLHIIFTKFLVKIIDPSNSNILISILISLFILLISTLATYIIKKIPYIRKIIEI